MSDLPPAAAARLSPRQAECLRLVFERRTSKEIAALTGLAVGTVDTYIAEAVAALGARNRRDAAEIHARLDTPGKVEPRSPGVPHPANPVPSEPLSKRMPGWSELLPLRPKGATGNDLRPLVRLGWILGLAAALAIAFGMLAVGAEVVSRFYAGHR